MPTITRTALSLVGITAAFALVLYLAYGSGNGGESTATPTPSTFAAASSVATPTPARGPVLTVTPAPSPTPSYLAGDLVGTSVIPLRQGEPIDLPDDVALIIETGCWQCDGPTTGLDRVYRDPFGKIRTETLVSAELLGLTNDSGNPPIILGFDALPDAFWIVVAFCTAGDCGWLGVPDANARTTFFESVDGGVTWSELADLEGTYWLASLVPGRREHGRDAIISGPIPTEGEYDPAFRYLKSGEPLEHPPEAGQYGFPRVSPLGDVLWYTGTNRLVDSGGDEFFYAGNATYLTEDIIGGSRWGVPWSLPTGNAPPPQFLTLMDAYGTTIRSLQYNRYISWGANSTDDVLYGNAEVDPGRLGIELPNPGFTFLPVEIHLNDATFHPIVDPFTADEFRFDRNRVVAVQQGPFARVVGVEGSCVNVRERPGLDSPIFTCVPEGVLLRPETTQQVMGQTWVYVSVGWVAAEYLEYSLR